MLVMDSNARRVRHVRFRAPSHEHARRAGTQLEDALRTASLPIADSGRLLVIRRLALGRIDPRWSAASIALAIENSIRNVKMDAVPPASPLAATSNAVQFEDRIEAVMLLARRLARRIVPTEWYWAAALPGWCAANLSQPWLALLNLVHRLPAPGPLLGAAAIVREAVAANAVPQLLAEIPPGAGANWLAASGFQTMRRVDFVELDFNDRSLAATIFLAADQREPEDRVLWLATIAAVADNPRRASDSALPTRVRSWLSAARVKKSQQRLAVTRAASSTPKNQKITQPGDTLIEPSLIAVSRDIPKTQIDESKRSGAECSVAQDAHDDTTQFAGLLFLIPALQRLGFVDWLEAHPSANEAGFGPALLRAFAARIAPCDKDPLILDLIRPVDLRAELLRDTRQFTAWISKTRRWCRTRARIGLHSLIIRRARICTSTAHIDLHFALDQSDLRVRRAGFDVDPGWVPWLGRIVRFHYDDNDRP
jgi:hypothetical protein